VLVLLPLATLLARRAVVFFCGHYARKTHLNESEYTRRNFCPRTASILARHAVAPDQQTCVVDTPRSLQTVPQVCPVTCTHALSHSVLHSTRAVNIVFSRTSSRRVGNSRPKTQHGTTAQGLCRASAQLTMNSVAWSGCMPTSNDAPRSVATCGGHVCILLCPGGPSHPIPLCVSPRDRASAYHSVCIPHDVCYTCSARGKKTMGKEKRSRRTSCARSADARGVGSPR
jgi:hypothetical protein